MSATAAALRSPWSLRTQRKQKAVASVVKSSEVALKAPHVFAPARIMSARTAG